ncbi:hypothetical protein OF83DRAFT_1154885 [Amylostereum chailletii]|nr:hypothetical protein OF83DRAFT_1154885 [Amylostereum chailletii]
MRIGRGWVWVWARMRGGAEVRVSEDGSCMGRWGGDGDGSGGVEARGRAHGGRTPRPRASSDLAICPTSEIWTRARRRGTGERPTDPRWRSADCAVSDVLGRVPPGRGVAPYGSHRRAYRPTEQQ